MTNKKEKVNNQLNFNFLTNNVKGLQSSKKRIKMFEYLKNKIGHKGILFLQETHSAFDTEKQWNDEFKGQLYFSHGKTNSCGVLIAFYGSINVVVKNQMNDDNGRILILEVTVDDTEYLLINMYNANTEQEQLKTLKSLSVMLENFDSFCSKNVILAGDFNFFFNKKLDCKGGNPYLKKQSVGHIIKLLAAFDLCDIWRIRNPKLKAFTFRQKHFSGIIQRRLDYMLISNSLQESVSNLNILNAFATDHSPVFCSFIKSSKYKNGPGFWKFNNSLILNSDFVEEMKSFICKTKQFLEQNNLFSNQSKWEFLKYEIRKKCVSFSKDLAQKSREKHADLLRKITKLEQDIVSDEKLEEYEKARNELDKIYNKIAEGVKIRSKCSWYQYGEKSSKFFYGLEKKNAICGTIKMLINDQKEITSPSEINLTLKSFYENLFKKNIKKSVSEINNFLDKIDLPTISDEHYANCETEITEENLFVALKSMPRNKSPGNDGLSIEFYETFWEDIKDIFFNSLKQAKVNGSLSISQRQAVIKLLEKKDRDKRFVKNWRPISLLNVDTKILSKAFAAKLKPILPSIVSSNQTAYVEKRCISESGRLISDIIEICDIENIPGYLVTMDLEKAFDSLDHDFLLCVLKKFGFGDNFITWIKILLNDQQSCVINGGFSSQYFTLEKGARQGDPISAYLFIIALEVLFALIKSKDDINGIGLYEHMFLFTAYADDSTFFLKDIVSVKVLIDTFKVFSCFSGLKPNINKCEIAGLGVLKGVQEAVCGLQNIDLTNDTIKILGVHFSYNKNVQKEKNYLTTVKKIQKALNVWTTRALTLEGKVLIFKTLGISKIVYLSLITTVPNSILDEIQKIQKAFLWFSSKPKINHKTLCNKFEDGGLKNVDIKAKIISLQCSWVKKLYDDNHHDWKIIPLYLINKYFGKNFYFHSSLSFNLHLIDSFPDFYKQIFINWSNSLVSNSYVSSCIQSNYLWYNKYILIDNKPVYLSSFSDKRINFLNDLLDSSGNFKTFNELKTEYNLANNVYFSWMQLINAIPLSWKTVVKNNCSSESLLLLNHHLIKKNNLISIEKLHCRELYNILVYNSPHKPTSQTYFENIFENQEINWKDIYTLPRKVSIDCNVRSFQYKVLNNILYLNKKLFIFGKSPSSLCSYCKEADETVLHLFSECHVTKELWKRLNLFFNGSLCLPELLPQTAFFGFIISSENLLLENHILLLFKIYLYNSRNQEKVRFNKLIRVITKVKDMEKEIAGNNDKKIMLYKKKWQKIEDMLLF